MDSATIYILIAILCIFEVANVISMFKNRDELRQEDLMEAIHLMQISKKTVSELRLDKEVQILVIARLVINGLEYAINHFTKKEDIINNAYIYTLEKAYELDIDLIDDREKMIRELIIVIYERNYEKQ